MTFVDEIIRSKSRIALIQVLNLNLRLMEAWRAVQVDLTGSPLGNDDTMILMAVIAIKTERAARTGELERCQDLSTPVDSGALGRCNLSSIAATTGLNRETVRRKIGDLERLNLVQREPDGGVTIADGLLQRPEVCRAVQKQVRAIAAAVERMRRDGILRG